MGAADGIKLLAALPGDWTLMGSVVSMPGNVRNYALAFGIAGIAGGVLLYINHKRRIDGVLVSDVSERVKKFEIRKYRRRTVVSSMVASAGCMMSALYWVTDAKVFSALILMILTLLVGILGVALFDLFSVGLHQIATPDDASQKAMIEDYLRLRKEGGKESNEGEEQG